MPYVNIRTTDRFMVGGPWSVEATATANLGSGEETANIPNDAAHWNDNAEPNTVWYVTAANVVQAGPILTKANRQTEWLSRIGLAYAEAIGESRKVWWPEAETYNSTDYWRAWDVVHVEIPNWLYDNTVILAAAIQERAWAGMTIAQVEAVVAHWEGLLRTPLAATATYSAAPNIVKRWYDVGKDQDTSTSNTDRRQIPGTDPARYGTGYASRTANTPYSDTFAVDTASNIITARVPDYAWSAFVSGTTPTNFDPEHPS